MSRAAPPSLPVAQALVLTAGFLAGVAGAVLVAWSGLYFPGEYDEARALGIVSPAILAGSSKQRDLIAYAASLVLPTLGALFAWTLWARSRREAVAALLAQPREPLPRRDRAWRWTLAAVALLMLLASFNLSGLLDLCWSPALHDWDFLGEEGENLAWAQVLLHGGVYGRDFFCLYGPLLVYPVAWLMRLFEPTVLMERLARYLFDLFAYAIVLAFLYRMCRWRTSFVLFAGCWFLVFPTFLVLPVNFTYLRFVLPLAAVLLVLRHAEEPSRLRLVGAGAVLGLALLFSQEAAVCGIVAIGTVLGLGAWQQGRWRKPFPELGLLGAGAAVAMAPMLLHLARHGALGALAETVFEFPRLTMLGWGANATPRLALLLTDVGHEFAAFFFTPLLYAGAAAALVPRLVRRRLGRDELWSAALVVFGALLYVMVIRRYAQASVVKAWAPAVLLFFLSLERAIHAALHHRDGRRVVGAAVAVVLLAVGGLVYGGTHWLTLSRERALEVATRGKWRAQPVGVRLEGFPRLGPVPLHAETARTLTSLDRFFEENSRPGEPVYFFPNEPAGYFLFDRPNPTRYAMAYFAITAAQRRELVAELERAKPRWVIHSTRSWRIDGIPEAVQVPEVVDYLEAHYRPHTELEGAIVLERLDR